MPKVVSSSCRCWVTFSVRLPSRMSMDCPAPKDCPRSRCSRSTVDSSICAGMVASQVSGGTRQVSQLPHGSLCWPKWASSRTRRHSTVSQRASIASSWADSMRRCAGRRPSRRSSCAAARRRPGRRPARRSRAGRRGRRGRSPGSSPRRTWAGPGARRTGRRACRCPCRTRWSPPSPGRPRAGTGTGGPRGSAGPSRVVRQCGDAVLHQELGGGLDRRPRQAVDDARVAGVLGAQQVQQLLAGLGLRHDAVLDVGPVEPGDDVQRVVQLQPGADLGVGARGGRRGQRDARDVGPRSCSTDSAR